MCVSVCVCTHERERVHHLKLKSCAGLWSEGSPLMSWSRHSFDADLLRGSWEIKSGRWDCKMTFKLLQSVDKLLLQSYNINSQEKYLLQYFGQWPHSATKWIWRASWRIMQLFCFSKNIPLIFISVNILCVILIWIKVWQFGSRLKKIK